MIKILGYDYTLDYSQDNRQLGAMGECHTIELTLKIANNLSPQQEVSTILHEIIEALNHALNLRLDNNVISPLEAGLYQTLTANGIDLSPLGKDK